METRTTMNVQEIDQKVIDVLKDKIRIDMEKYATRMGKKFPIGDKVIGKSEIDDNAAIIKSEMNNKEHIITESMDVLSFINNNQRSVILYEHDLFKVMNYLIENCNTFEYDKNLLTHSKYELKESFDPATQESKLMLELKGQAKINKLQKDKPEVYYVPICIFEGASITGKRFDAIVNWLISSNKSFVILKSPANASVLEKWEQENEQTLKLIPEKNIMHIAEWRKSDAWLTAVERFKPFKQILDREFENDRFKSVANSNKTINNALSTSSKPVGVEHKRSTSPLTPPSGSPVKSGSPTGSPPKRHSVAGQEEPFVSQSTNELQMLMHALNYLKLNGMSATDLGAFTAGFTITMMHGLQANPLEPTSIPSKVNKKIIPETSSYSGTVHGIFQSAPPKSESTSFLRKSGEISPSSERARVM